jgi:Flp pilus assembly pilin Flp
VSRRDDDGSALVEFTYLAILLMVPLVYVLLTVFQVQRAAFGTTEAAREGARAYERAGADDLGEQRARAAIGLALRDQGVTDEPQVGFSCGASSCFGPDGRVKVTVTSWVKLPLLGSVFGDARRGAIRVQSSHVEFADRYAAR